MSPTTSAPPASVPLSSEDLILQALRKIVRAIDLRSRALADEHGVTGPQLAVLRELARNGPRGTTDLAAAVHLSPATVSGIVQRLVARGAVQRTVDASDRRIALVALSEVGHELLRQVPSPLQETFRRELERLALWEQYGILSSLERIAAMMGASDLDAAPHLVVGPIDTAPRSTSSAEGDPS